jgi:protein-disulfide isomerase
MSKLTPPISQRDHIQGYLDATMVLVEYGDYECPHCAAAYPIVKTVQAVFGDQLCFAYRHFPLVQIHPHAEPAAEAAEAAGAQRRFWEMHDALFRHSPVLDALHLLKYAKQIGLPIERFRRELSSHRFLPRVQEDIDSGLASGVQGTPTFFINGVRHPGGYDLMSLLEALKAAQYDSVVNRS